MAESNAIAGPVPDGADAEEYDRLRRRVMSTFSYGLYVIGSRDGDRRNGMTANWVTQLSFEPTKKVGVSVEKAAFTHELISAGRSFTVNVIARDDREIVRKFTKPVEVDTEARTLNGFGYQEGPTGAPILTQAAAWVDCRLVDELDCGGHTFFVGEVVSAGFGRDEGTDVLRIEDTRMNYAG